jgi:hypothetical protein
VTRLLIPAFTEEGLLYPQGLLGNTLVIFTTDNGYLHGEHGLADKWYPFEESIRTPLIVADPRMPAAVRGTTNDALTLNVDLAPTILAAVLADIAVYCVQGWRWNLLLSPLGSLPKLRTMQAIYVGLFANELLPLRPGEVIRSFLQARWSGVPFSIQLLMKVMRLLSSVVQAARGLSERKPLSAQMAGTRLSNSELAIFSSSLH